MNKVLSDKNAEQLAETFGCSPEVVREAFTLTQKGSIGRASHLLRNYGVEYVSCAGREMAYINNGETYDLTICREGAVTFLSSWGDWYEEVENAHCEKEGVVRCGYCAEFTPIVEGEEWHEVECEHCENLVGG